MFYTSYFANLRNIPDRIVPISICGKAPKGYTGLEYKKLAPKYWFFKKYKEDGDWIFFMNQYFDQVLDKLDAYKVYNELWELSGGKPFVLVCYEKPGDNCHRHLVSEWFGEHGCNCEEYSLYGTFDYWKEESDEL